MTSATERLRALLDERGVMHGYVEPDCVWWEGDEGIAYAALEVYVLDEPSGYFDVRDLTPQQAIDATLGRGTCRDVGRYSFVCSVCGWASDEPHHMLGGFWPKYCPECGRAVVE